MQKSERLPQHVAIIPDGNGRWAKKRGLPRTAGHAAGIKRIRETIRAAHELGIPVLTFYSFSTENWKRPRHEVNYLMQIPIGFLESDLQELIKRNVKVQILGDKEGVPSPTQRALDQLEQKTKNNTGMILNLAVNYGSRREMVEMVRQISGEVSKGNIEQDEINEDVINQFLFTKDLPDPDLLIRTSGVIRISNFLLWQLAYSELWFTDVPWPDFTPEMFHQAIEDFEGRLRRYGAV